MTPAAAADVSAVLDIGSNSVLLLAVAVDPDGRARAVDEALATTRLGAGLRDGGRPDAAAVARTCAAVADFAARARAAGASNCWGFATAAVRRADDPAALAGRLAEAARAPVEILAGEREAALGWAAVAHGLARTGGPLLVADVGGGTTELTLGRAGVLEDVESLPLGALRLTEAHLADDPPRASAVAECEAVIDATFVASHVLRDARACGASLVLTGGTATALAASDLGLDRYVPARVHGHGLDGGDVATVARHWARLPLAARHRLLPFDPERAAMLPAGALVVTAIAARIGVATMRVSEHGVRHGYLRERLAACGITVDLRALWR